MRQMILIFLDGKPIGYDKVEREFYETEYPEPIPYAFIHFFFQQCVPNLEGEVVIKPI